VWDRFIGGDSTVYGPAPTLSATTGTAGTTITVNGNNFAASARVTVTFNGNTVATGTTDGAGAIAAPITFNVPNVGSSTYKVTVYDNRSQYPVSFSFVVP
jgi:hypothetical protein